MTCEEFAILKTYPSVNTHEECEIRMGTDTWTGDSSVVTDASGDLFILTGWPALGAHLAHLWAAWKRWHQIELGNGQAKEG